MMVAKILDGKTRFEVRPSLDSSFYFDFNLLALQEVNKSYGLISRFDMNAQTFSFFQNTSFSPLNASAGAGAMLQHIRLVMNSTLKNNASVTLEFNYYNTNGTLNEQVNVANLTLGIAPNLPVLVAEFRIEGWPFLRLNNSLLQFVGGVVLNVSPLAVASTTRGMFSLISVPYTSGYYLLSYVNSYIIVDSSANWTLIPGNNFEVTSYSQPVSADVMLTFPSFNKSVQFVTYAAVANAPAAMSPTVLITIVVVVVVLVILVIIAIVLLSKYSNRISGSQKKEEKE